MNTLRQFSRGSINRVKVLLDSRETGPFFNAGNRSYNLNVYAGSKNSSGIIDLNSAIFSPTLDFAPFKKVNIKHMTSSSQTNEFKTSDSKVEEKPHRRILTSIPTLHRQKTDNEEEGHINQLDEYQFKKKENDKHFKKDFKKEEVNYPDKSGENARKTRNLFIDTEFAKMNSKIKVSKKDMAIQLLRDKMVEKSKIKPLIKQMQMNMQSDSTMHMNSLKMPTMKQSDTLEGRTCTGLLENRERGNGDKLDHFLLEEHSRKTDVSKNTNTLLHTVLFPSNKLKKMGQNTSYSESEKSETNSSNESSDEEIESPYVSVQYLKNQYTKELIGHIIDNSPGLNSYNGERESALNRLSNAYRRNVMMYTNFDEVTNLVSPTKIVKSTKDQEQAVFGRGGN